ncbi:hypothetical protein E2C01_098507 [Portunus trituberculatus]|uniref:Uncharacterized protein n=1 Tax=Portunus trituberculatus TaxID=210409 RepID=A0A5B7KC95_PORTR|nr:hypothetical protein [Portunus trituberculatus]
MHIYIHTYIHTYIHRRLGMTRLTETSLVCTSLVLLFNPLVP